MNSIAIIPARAGSKRILNKNIFEILGKPALAYSISTALESGIFSKVFVSTDSLEIARIAESYGAHVGRLRNPNLSGDYNSTIEVVSEFIKSEFITKNYPDYICCIYPVTPLLTSERLQEGLNSAIEESDKFTLAAIPVISHPERIFRLNKQLGMILEHPNHSETRTQDLGPYFQDAGQFYWAATNIWLSQKTILGTNCRVVKLNKYEVIDVDEIEDMKLLEILVRARKN